MGDVPDSAVDAMESVLRAVSSPAELRQLLDTPGVTDEVIGEFTRAVGTERLLDRAFDLIARHFLPERAGGEGGLVRWRIETADGTYVYHLSIAGGRAEGGRAAELRAGDLPRVTLTMTLPILLKLCAGRLSGVTALMKGTIKISGDIMFGAKLQSWFDY